uniref:uncharacterized protein n=1 Tax=Lonchura striata TaxID=40157 RepID=UPI001293DA91|nr:uncharacterized protein LOC110467600 [Lonchura striata domestica]
MAALPRGGSRCWSAPRRLSRRCGCLELLLHGQPKLQPRVCGRLSTRLQRCGRRSWRRTACPPPPFGRDAWPRGRRAGSCGVRWWLLPSKPDESNGSWSVTGACTNMTKRCPKSMASSMFCRKFGISQK